MLWLPLIHSWMNSICNIFFIFHTQMEPVVELLIIDNSVLVVSWDARREVTRRATYLEPDMQVW
mgnify:CR=1 FL=1